MGQKVNPNGFRFGINRNWQSRWIAGSRQQTARWIIDDYKVRKLLFNKFRAAYVDRIEIERTATRYDVFFYVMTPALITGQEDSKLPALILEINKIVGRKVKVNISVIPVAKPELSATIIAREIADAIENRVSFRNAQKLAIKKVMRAGAKGIRTNVAGRLGGTEIAREEGYVEGQSPLTTLRSDIDYSLAEAKTPYGQIGCKVWINRGEIFEKGKEAAADATAPVPPADSRLRT